MAFSYDNTLGDNRSVVRFLLGDTTTPGVLSDEEIVWLIAQEANVYMAAAAGADNIATQAQNGSTGSVTQRKVDDLTITYERGADRAASWKTLATQLRARGSTYMVPDAAITRDDRDAIRDNDDLLRPTFFSGALSDPTARPTNDRVDDERWD